MDGLFLRSGGRLDKVRWVYDDAKGEGSYVTRDVTSCSSGYLMESVIFDGDIRLKDILSLLHSDVVLQAVFRRDWAAEYSAEMLKGDSTPFTGEYDADEIEYLELYSIWEKNSATNEVEGISRLSFHGIGFELRDDSMQGDMVVHPKGSRIPWGLTFSPIRELLDLPVKVNPNIVVCEGYTKSDKYGHTLETLVSGQPTLGQVIHGILWEISFHGGPEETKDFAETLRHIRDDLTDQDLIDDDAESDGLPGDVQP
jgi:hypothetical protein